MNTKRLPTNRTVPNWFVALGSLVLAVSAQAQQAPYYNQQPGVPQQPRYAVPPGSPPPPTYVPPPQPTYQQQPSTGNRVGGFFRRLFYGERNEAPAQGQYYPSPQGRSLDVPPAGYRPGMGFNEPTSQPSTAQIDPELPASSRAGSSQLPKPTTKTTPSTSKSGSSSRSSKKYSPPRVKEDAPPSKPSRPTMGTEPSSTPKTPEPPSTPEPTPAPSSSAPPKVADEPLPGYTPPSSTPPAGSGMATPKPKDPAPSSSSSGAFLVGKKTGKEGRVTSPYPPYKELDVTGLPSGSLALDPTTQKVFEVP